MCQPLLCPRGNPVASDNLTRRPFFGRRYENLVQIRCLLEGDSEEDILNNWHTILPDRMARWQLDRSEVRLAVLLIVARFM